ncbi:hypothetical protein FHR64_002998 [Xanthomonas arboricola]|nr:hypothetical protein [Xanthomonas arboricola]
MTEDASIAMPFTSTMVVWGDARTCRWAAMTRHRASAAIAPARPTSGERNGLTPAHGRPLSCGLAAGPLPAHHRRTRRKYVHVGSYAASMPRKVPRRWAGKDQSRWSVCRGAHRAWRALFGGWCVEQTFHHKQSNKQAFNQATDAFSGAVSSPIAGPCGGMDATTEPTRTYLRRVPRAVRAPRTRPTRLLTASQSTANKTTALATKPALTTFDSHS